MPVKQSKSMSLHHLKIDNKRWQALRRQVFERDGFRCRACQTAGRLEADHILPLPRERPSR